MYVKEITLLMAVFITMVTCKPGKTPPYSRELETLLRDNLFDGYSVMQRPKKTVTVRISINLLALNYLNIKEQKLSVTAYFHIVWPDGRLEWKTNDTFSDIRFLFATEKSLWKPALIVENSVDHIDVISKPAVPLRIFRNGRVTWLPAGIFTTHCESYITYWPLDTQTCDIIVSSWGYTWFEVELMFDALDRGIILAFYQDTSIILEHGEWELLNHTHSLLLTEREFESFSRLVFTFTFRRRPLFHMLNTLFPVALMGFLTVAIFKLSPESGERVGLALTILLAYALYLSLISENIPQTSMSASLLSSYLASTLFLQTLAVLLTVIYLDVYFAPEQKPVPRWLQVVTQCCLARIACIDCSKRRKDHSEQTGDTVENICNYDSRTMSLKADHETESGKRCVEAWVDDDSDDVTKEYTWKEIALLLDKVTMYIYLILETCLTVFCVAIMLHHYFNAYYVF